METPRFGIILRVNDLDGCRRFYQSTLGLGTPAMDSSFAVEFCLSANLSLYLEQSAALYLTHSSDAASLVLEVGDDEALAALRTRLEYAGQPLGTQPDIRSSGCYYRGADPEGNVFWVGVRRAPRKKE